MGSWLLTCALTLTAVEEGDPVRLIFLCQTPRRNAAGHGLVHSTDGWCPISLPLPGTYEGYGRVALSTDAATDYRFFAESLLPLALTKQGAAVGDAVFDPDALQKRLISYGLFVRTSPRFCPAENPGLRMGMMIVHEDAYTAFSTNCWDGPSHIDLANLVAQAHQALDSLDAALTKEQKMEAHEEAKMSALRIILDIGRGTTRLPGMQMGLNSLLDPARRNNNGVRDRDFIARIVRFVAFHENFCDTRRVYAPTLSAGEDIHADLQKRLGHITANIITRQSA